MTAQYDTSGKGKSALTAAAYRGLEAEVYSYTEEQVIGAFHDFASLNSLNSLTALKTEIALPPPPPDPVLSNITSTVLNITIAPSNILKESLQYSVRPNP